MWHTGRSERTCRLPACLLCNSKTKGHTWRKVSMAREIWSVISKEVSKTSRSHLMTATFLLYRPYNQPALWKSLIVIFILHQLVLAINFLIRLVRILIINLSLIYRFMDVSLVTFISASITIDHFLIITHWLSDSSSSVFILVIFIIFCTPTWAISCNRNTPKSGWNRGGVISTETCNIAA